ncbi:MAG: hypothetical protein GTO54_01505, partial [Nitrososphaeria archaeon]|nr:hypothetical protein [Nitrososphaeria archaeon]
SRICFKKYSETLNISCTILPMVDLEYSISLDTLILTWLMSRIVGKPRILAAKMVDALESENITSGFKALRCLTSSLI